MARLALFSTVAFSLSFAGCSSVTMFGDPSLVLDSRLAPSWITNVENGSAFDGAEVEPGDAKTVVLPDTAILRRTSEDGPIRLFMEKQLGFAGDPVELWSIRESRKNMGCAVMVEGDKLVIATYGEFQTIEGGAYMRLVAIVPNDLEVERRIGLAGQKSVATSQEEGLVGPASGWQAVHDKPDPSRIAQEHKN
jgi:hypothetical protein